MSCSLSLAALALFLQFFFQWRASCSSQSCAFKNLKSLALTEDSVSHFTPFLKNGFSSPPIVWLRYWFPKRRLDQFCLKYLISSVVVLGKVDECALQAICEFFSGIKVAYLMDLSHGLAQRNDFDTVVQFVARNLKNILTDYFSFKNFVAGLMKENWRAMEKLAVGILAILKDNATRRAEYHFILRNLPAERQYEMIRSGEVPADTVDSIYFFEKDYLILREMFFLAGCSCNPNLEIRGLIAEKYPHFRQPLARQIAEDSEANCLGAAPALDTDLWHSVSKFVNAEELIFVWPLVCRSWLSLYSKILTYDTRIHDLYLLDLSFTGLYNVHEIAAPWKLCLRSREKAFRYLQRCIEHGVLDRIKPKLLLQGNLILQCNLMLQGNLKQYLKAVIKNETPLPVINGCATQLETFLYLFEKIHVLCANERPTLRKPKFLTSQEYEEAVRYFLFTKGWSLKISESLMIQMPKLLDDVMRDAELVKKLILLNVRSFLSSCLALVLCGREDRIPEELAILLLPLAFRSALTFNQPPSSRDYYDLITKDGYICVLIVENHNMVRVYKLVFSIVMSLRGSPDEIEKVVQSITRYISDVTESYQTTMKGLFGSVDILAAEKMYAQEDIGFFKEIMERCGLLEGFRVVQ